MTIAHIKTPAKRTRRGTYFICETCSDMFYVMPSRIEQSEKVGSKIRFCSHKCYKKIGKNNPFYGKKHSEDTIRKMMVHPNRKFFKNDQTNPNFYRFAEELGFKGTSCEWWVKYLKKKIGKCEKCGFDDRRILQVHHIDRNRKHNTRENLKLFCPNCHYLEHYLSKDGLYNGLK